MPQLKLSSERFQSGLKLMAQSAEKEGPSSCRQLRPWIDMSPSQGWSIQANKTLNRTAIAHLFRCPSQQGTLGSDSLLAPEIPNMEVLLVGGTNVEMGGKSLTSKQIEARQEGNARQRERQEGKGWEMARCRVRIGMIA